MIISRRPNKRASSEKAPGPRNTMATVMMPAKISDSFASNKFGAGVGRTDNATPTATTHASTPAMGVRNPASSDAPAASPNKPPNHIPSVEWELSER
jgi:hypothetical protein